MRAIRSASRRSRSFVRLDILYFPCGRASRSLPFSPDSVCRGVSSARERRPGDRVLAARGFATGRWDFSTARPCTGGKLAHLLCAPPVALGFRSPSMVPSSADGLGGKARMFERMDARVRAGPSPASSAGNRAQRGTSVGRAFSWFLLFSRAKRRNSVAAEADEASRRIRIKRVKPGTGSQPTLK